MHAQNNVWDKEKLANQIYNSKSSSNNQNSFPFLTKLTESHIGTVIKVLPHKIGNVPILFILNKKGRLYKLNISKKQITELSYTGEFCQDIKFFSHSNLEVIVICHTQSNNINFYFVNSLNKNSRTRSRVPTVVTGFNPQMKNT